MNKSLISVVVPVYKVENYLDECITSIINQTYNNLEIILVDDGSPDKCPEMCDRWAEIDSRIRVIHKENGGLSSARNVGIDSASGEYIFFLDSDDMLFPNSLQELWDIVENYPHVDMVKGDFYIDGVSDSILCQDFPSYSEDVNWIRNHFCNLSIPESACNSLMRRLFIVDNQLFFKEGWIQEDTLWAFKIQRYIKSLAFCFKQTYFYRTNPNSIMHTMDKEKEANAYSRIYNEAYHDMLSTKIELCELRYLEIIAGRVWRAIGKRGLRQLCTSQNPFFNMLFRCNRINNNNKRSVLIITLLEKCRCELRKILCIKSVFCYSSVNSTL